MIIWWVVFAYVSSWDWKKWGKKELATFLIIRKRPKFLRLFQNYTVFLAVLGMAIIGEWWIFFLWIMGIPALALTEAARQNIHKKYLESGIEEGEYVEVVETKEIPRNVTEN